MTQEERLDILAQVASGIAKVLGDDTEVVLHDLTKREIVFMHNSKITGRERNYRINPTVYDVISNLADGEGHLIGYASKSAQGKKLRASHFMFMDEDNNPAAMICINQDPSRIQEIISYLSESIKIRDVDETAVNDTSYSLNDEDYIQNIMKDAIIKSVKQLDPGYINTKEGKLMLLRKFKFQGVFSVKEAVPFICETLSISQATLYNYLREIRDEEGREPYNELKLR
ncbi:MULTISPECIES: helix-turn-helix transcriptional regulator [Mogibacterium]|jgi:yheO domain protein|uniref:PAS domain-containing protein n=1 Tax=Mogibacterium timidum TaxID=35519 RepID=A0A7Y8VRF9_9FIRM|nr:MULTISPECIES: PAS domain-containing protein [Mogibacterium]EJU20258.1 YheO-like protein [Mogibacterium sp. CM50]NWO23306.1 PAS domain-containing protein [Mogibacterium timidum]